MTKITTDIAGNETTSQMITKLRDVSNFWFGTASTSAATTWGALRVLMNSACTFSTSVSATELGASFVTKRNWLNDPDQVIPATIFAGARQGVWYDPSDLSTLFQDAAGTTPVTAPGQSVGRVLDKSGRGNHATQVTAAARPVYGVVPSRGLVNLVPATNNLAAAGWNKGGCSVVGDKIIPNTSVVQHSVSTSHSAVLSASNQAYTFAADFKADGMTTATLHIQGQSPSYRRAWQINLAAGIISNAGGTAGSTNIGQSITPLEDGWYHVVVTGIPQSEAVTGAAVSVFVPAEPAIAGDGVSGIRMRNENFVVGSVEGVFQHVVSKYEVIDPVGFPSYPCHYLSFDGVDDFLQTGNIDWGTDEVTITAGLRKLSDAARGMVAELGPFVNQRNFQLNAPTPNLNDYGFFSAGTTVASFATAASAPNTSVVTGQAKITTDTLILRRNAAQTGTTVTDQGTGSAYDTNPLYIGMRAGTSLPFNGILFGLTAVNAVLDATQLGMVERFTNFNTGGF